MTLRPDSFERVPSRRAEHAGVALWVSFLTACGATLFFFGYFDPLTLAVDLQPPKWLADRRTGYAVGFFFFWIVSATAAAFTAFMIDTRSTPDGK